jgi:hypothetical protein
MSVVLLSELESSVLAALERGDGVVPCYTGTRPRETEAHVSHAVEEALDYAFVMADLLALLKVGADDLPGRIATLRQTIAQKYAEQIEDGIREAREDAAQEDWLERDTRGVFA